MVHLNSFNQTLEGSERPPDVQQLDPTVVEQLISFVGQQCTHGSSRKLFAWISATRTELGADVVISCRAFLK